MFPRRDLLYEAKHGEGLLLLEKEAFHEEPLEGEVRLPFMKEIGAREVPEEEIVFELEDLRKEFLFLLWLKE